MRELLLVIISLCFFNVIKSQDVDQLGSQWDKLKKTKPIEVKGGFNATTGLYHVDGIENRKDPFVYALNANLNFNIYGLINMPFAINYNNKQVTETITDPRDIIKGIINKTGFSPKYKAVTLHIGERSMQFSQYVYSGLMFYGLGIEVKPKDAWFSISAFRGRLQEATMPVDVNLTETEPTFKRMGYGAMLGLGSNINKIRFIVFHAEDDLNSLDSIPSSSDIKPQENLVIGVSSDNKFYRKLNIKLEYNISALSTDTRTSKSVSPDDFTYFNNTGGIFTPRLSTSYSRAFISSATWKESSFTLGGKFRRIAPGYYSLGALGAENDLMDYTLNASIFLFKGKINVSGSFGEQQNNLEQQLLLTKKQYIGSANLTYILNKNLTLVGSYSNYNLNTSPSYIAIEDTTHLMQVNKNIMGTATYIFGKKELKQSLILTSNTQLAEDVQWYVSDSSIVSETKVFNNILNYSINVESIATQITSSITLTDLTTSATSTNSKGVSLGANRKFLDNKIKGQFTFAYLNTSTNKIPQSVTKNIKINFSYKINKHHSLKFDNALVIKNDKLNTDNSFTEYQGKLTYAYVF